MRFSSVLQFIQRLEVELRLVLGAVRVFNTKLEKLFTAFLLSKGTNRNKGVDTKLEYKIIFYSIEVPFQLKPRRLYLKKSKGQKHTKLCGGVHKLLVIYFSCSGLLCAK